MSARHTPERAPEPAVTVLEERVAIPTYAEGKLEAMPMFAENRVHQRTSGRPYPNRVVQRVDRANRADRVYTLIRLENAYLAIGILPELGGRIFYATDKTTGYDFFYRQHVIKPALIGCLGSWISGGVEFNFPFHHRPSTYMPVDYSIEREADGAVTVWLSEHDPMERMKGMVGIRLRPGEAMLETRMRVSNRTPVGRSFLWWENAAVPVNEDYEIFFPPDVTNVCFHYHRSVTTWPLAAGVFNGLVLGDDTDIRLHRNTRRATSYFSAASKYDFFGGYDRGRRCGVVHVANHHVSPGKKLFTWAYCQLSRSWEKALTDSDGAYAELMAGSYTDNQPDFAWLEPFETKKFSQYWYPISGIGAPLCANTNAALSLGRDAGKIVLAVQAVRAFAGARLRVAAGDVVLHDAPVDLPAAQPVHLRCAAAPGLLSVTIHDAAGAPLLAYAEEPAQAETIPAPWTDLPGPEHFTTAQELHLAGVHVAQYRSPHVLPDAYWKAALERDPDYLPALVDLAGFHYLRGGFAEAEALLRRALAVATRHNGNPRDGTLFYLLGLVLLAQNATDAAYDAFYKATWNEACRSRGMTMLAAIDGRRGDFPGMLAHAEEALACAADNPLAGPLAAAAEWRGGAADAALARLDRILAADPLNHLARYLRLRAANQPLAPFYAALHSAPAQTCLDLAGDLLNAGLRTEARALLEGLTDGWEPMLGYTLGVLCLDAGEEEQAAAWFRRAEQAPCGNTFPFRLEELAVLRAVLRHAPSLPRAWHYLGCLLYDKGQHADAADCWQRAIALDDGFHIPHRNLAVACFSHLGRHAETLPLLRAALDRAPGDEQLVYETCHVMARLGTPPAEREAFIGEHCAAAGTRDDIVLERARALNQMTRPEQALALLAGHTFVPCEGGEHAVAEQFMFAHHQLGRDLLRAGRCAAALAHFQSAQVLPDNLGAGLWHEVLRVPHQYYAALCLERLGRTAEAHALCAEITAMQVEYFANMHLPELPLYQALALRLTGRQARAGQALRTLLADWTAALAQRDAGHFRTTPFFISYIDDPRQARAAQFRHLTGLARAALGDSAGALADFRASVAADPSRLYPWLECRLCQP
jgi:tetratricopeptide (TPR) repeat protein